MKHLHYVLNGMYLQVLYIKTEPSTSISILFSVYYLHIDLAADYAEKAIGEKNFVFRIS